jgi:glycosyltransferase involved in cell wall biosynthesis
LSISIVAAWERWYSSLTPLAEGSRSGTASTRSHGARSATVSNSPSSPLERGFLFRRNTTNVGCVPEVVDDGITGLLVAPGDEAALAAAVVKLLLDDARRAHMEKRSRVVAEQRFDATVWVSSLLDFYLEVV